MFKNFRIAFLLFFTVLSLPLRAQEDVAVQYKTAMAAFDKGEWAAAASGLQLVITEAAPGSQLEPVFFTLCAAYYNAADYPNAIKSFLAFQQSFPKSGRLTQIQMGLAQTYLLSKEPEKAAEIFRYLERIPEFRDDALIAQAKAMQDAGKPAEAIVALKKLVDPGIKTEGAARGGIMLVPLYLADQQNAGKGIDLLRQLQGNIALVENVTELNTLCLTTGDSYFRNQSYEDALTCYRLVRKRDQVLEFQKARIGAMKKRQAEIVTAIRANPAGAANYFSANNKIRADIVDAEKLYAKFAGLPNYTPLLYVRIGRCFYETKRKWESLVVYDELLSQFPKVPESETALFGSIVSLSDVGQYELVQEKAVRYLQDFPNAVNATAAGYLQAAAATQLENNDEAVQLLTKYLATHSEGEVELQARAEKDATVFGARSEIEAMFRKQSRILLGQTYFSMSRYKESAAAFAEYLTKFPQEAETEDIEYRMAMCQFFDGESNAAVEALKKYMAKYPEGRYVPDARLRLAMQDFSDEQFDKALAATQKWEADFPKHEQLGEVLSLQGDTLAAQGKKQEAVDSYVRAAKTTTNTDISGNALGEAAKLLQSGGKWEEIGAIFQDFIKTRPDDPIVPAGVYWTSRSLSHQGKQEEAKQFAAETIVRYIQDRNREGVELLLTQLAQLCAKKSAQPEGTTAPLPEAEIDRLLLPVAKMDNPTARARLIFTKAELARLQRRPEDVSRLKEEIAKDFSPDDLSPTILGQLGDFLTAKGDFDKATVYFEQLRNDFPKSGNIDFAYNGLGQIALARKEYDKALAFFTDALEKYPGNEKLKDATVGKAQALMALNRLDEAEKVFQQISSVREWRGETTALSVYSLGRIEELRKKLPEAIAYYQRVYVAYKKYLPWVAKAYTSSGEAFEKLGKRQEAINTYQEMMRNPKLASFPETELARKRLQELGAS